MANTAWGPAFNEVLDGARLRTQMEVIRDFMLGAGWKTLGEIEAEVGYPQASVSAQLRHLRRDWAGSYEVLKRRRTNGTWEYSVLPPEPKGQMKLL
jgi:hypothetical protein